MEQGIYLQAIKLGLKKSLSLSASEKEGMPNINEYIYYILDEAWMYEP